MTRLFGHARPLTYGLVLLTLVAGCGEDKPQEAKASGS